METAHARLSPSGSYRWMTCLGSVAMEDGEPDDCNEYTDEGTAAHALAAICLKDGSHPAAYLGRVIEVVNGVYWPGGDAPLPPKLRGHDEDIRRSFEMDTDRIAAINTYVQRIREFAMPAEGGGFVHQLFVEERLPIGHITGEEDAEGTGDGVIITADGDELQAHDLKFGMGVKVFAKENPQLLHYLLGALKKFPGNYSRFRLVVHQPRLHHLDEWDCDRATLDAFAEKAAGLAAAARIAFEHRQNWLGRDESYLQVSDAACQFCKAKAKCPALAKHVERTVGADFEVLGALAKSDDPKALDGLIPMDLQALGQHLAAVDLVEDWCRAIRARVETALFEHHNSEEAIAALGHKLVQGRKGARAWRNEADAEATLKGFRLKSDEMYTYKLITPTKAEALLKDQPKRWAKVAPLIGQADGKPSVAPADDKRPALALTPAIDDFDVVANGIIAPLVDRATEILHNTGADLV